MDQSKPKEEPVVWRTLAECAELFEKERAARIAAHLAEEEKKKRVANGYKFMEQFLQENPHLREPPRDPSPAELKVKKLLTQGEIKLDVLKKPERNARTWAMFLEKLPHTQDEPATTSGGRTTITMSTPWPPKGKTLQEAEKMYETFVRTGSIDED